LLSDTVILKREVVRSSETSKGLYGLKTQKDHNLINSSRPQTLKAYTFPQISCDTLDMIECCITPWLPWQPLLPVCEFSVVIFMSETLCCNAMYAEAEETVEH